MDIHNNNDDNDHRAATIANESHRRYTNSISHFCNWLAQQPSHRHMTRHNNNGEIVLIYNRVDVAAVKTYLCRRRLRYPHWSTVMKLHDTGHVLQMNRCLVRTAWEYNNTYDITV